MFDENLDILHIMKNCDQVDTCCTYGLYIIHDNKIYREMFASYPNGKPVFPAGLHDLFRIYDYEANACFNIDDCYTCLKEHNVTLSNTQDKELKSFWNKYPDSIICFGWYGNDNLHCDFHRDSGDNLRQHSKESRQRLC